MKPVPIHQPGTPTTPEPPEQLVELADAIKDPHLKQVGVTVTPDGRWALYATVPADATVPIPNVEAQAQGFPVVYEAEPSEPPRARPAYPRRKGAPGRRE